MAFRIGQKVCCIDASSHKPPISTLREGVVYTVAGFDEIGYLLLEEAHHVETPTWGFYPSRFRPVVDRKTSISIFKEILDRENHGLPSRVDYPCDVEGK